MKILPLFKAAFLSALMSTIAFADDTLTENKTILTDDDLSTMFPGGSTYKLDGSKYSIYANKGTDDDANYSGAVTSGWCNYTITNMGDVSSLGITYNEDGSLASYTSQGIVGFEGFLKLNGSLTITDSVFADNIGAASDSYSVVKVYGGTLSIDNSVFINNKDKAVVENSTAMTISNSSFIGNEYAIVNSWAATTATVSDDGFITGGSVISNTLFQANGDADEAWDNLVINKDKSKLTITESEFISNTSRVAVSTSGDSTVLNVNNTLFDDNVRSMAVNWNSVLYLSDSEFKNNGTVDDNGNANDNAAILSASNSSQVYISNITADNNNGSGIIFVDTGATISIEDSTFTNTNGNYGGVVSIKNSTMNVTDSMFTDNKATSGGGAFYIVASTDDTTVNINVEDSSMKYAGNTGGAAGFMLLISTADENSNTYDLNVNFNIAEDKVLEIGNYGQSTDEIRTDWSNDASNQTITKTGDGSLGINSSMSYYYGNLVVEDGSMYVNSALGSSNITVDEGSMLAIRAEWSTLTNTTSTTIVNDGTLIFTSKVNFNYVSEGISLASGALTLTGEGTVKVYGGTIDFTTNTFYNTVAKTISLGSFSSTIISQNGRFNILNTDGNVLLEMQFNNSAEEFTVTMLEGIDVSTNDSIEVAYKLTSTGLVDGDSALISFLIDDTTLSVGDFQIYSMDGSDWEAIEDLEYLQYDGQYLSFITSDLTSEFGYGYVTAVPEPSTYAAIAGALALGLAIYRRRK